MATSKLDSVASGVEVIRNIACPDGKPRRFSVQGIYDPKDASRYGYVSVTNNGKQSVVSGIARRVGRGWKFVPHINGKNTHLIAPASIPIGTAVTIKDSRINGSIIAVGFNYLTPIYTVQPLDKRRKPIAPVAADNIVRL